MMQTVELNDILVKQGINPETVLVLRHRPTQPELRKVLPWLATEKPQIYNAYQPELSQISSHSSGEI